ncbi:Pseudouridine synthase family protein [Forsythia ovata]|uniref:Pseudouridine synthase family protein n=1 Tax=Forsythia ovata TaxID=205694 RepID=A0ABD1QTU3_9LAMI
MSSVEESDVGIFCYISKLPGFRGILKQRYSDFIVNEVGLDGNVVHLNSLEVPPEISEEKTEKTPVQLNNNYATEIESFRALAGDSDAEKLKSFVNQIVSHVNVDDTSIVLSPSSDKAHRTEIHNFFKQTLNFLVTDTIDGPDSSSKCIRVRMNSGGNNGKGRNSKKRKDRGDKAYDSRGSDSWPEHLGKFLRFHLYKENKDTQETLGLLGKMLGIQPRSFGFAGTKDKRSVSTQRVTVFKQRASRLAVLNERLIGIKVGDFCYVNDGLVLGQLQGNRFTVTLRGVMAESEDIIRASATALGKHGFINYFGLQRFGSSSVPTHLVGATLLRGDWKAAIREYYKESGDIEGTLRQLPRQLVAERAIFQCLKKNPANYLQALMGIPRTLRMMFIHSYQSYLWNHAASMRVQKYGFNQVILGDLVYSKEQDTKNETGSSKLEFEDSSSNEVDINGHFDDISVTDLPAERNMSVKALNEEDIGAGNYTVDDIVLPLPGSRVIYPLNDIGKVYQDLAKKDDISLTESAHNTKEFSITNVTGSYRRLFQKPKDFEWELVKYTDRDMPLAETDWDIIANSRPTTLGCNEKSAAMLQNDLLPNSDKFEDATEASTENRGTESETVGGLKLEETINGPATRKNEMALKLRFTLPASSYATMAIRELLKTSTSVAFHKALNM